MNNKEWESIYKKIEQDFNFAQEEEKSCRNFR